MIKNKKVLGIIPARGGSKGLPRKNILDLCGKPLISWTIEEANKSIFIDKLIVSTDDQEIIEVSKKYGCEVPFKRPKKFSRDKSTTNEVIMHSIDSISVKFDVIIVLQPTSPLRTSKDIDNSLKKLIENDCFSVISMCLSDKPYEWFHHINSEGFIKNIFDSKMNNRQLSKNAYVPNGAIYTAHVDIYKQKKTFYHKNSMAYIMPKHRSIDIDDKLDFKMAKFLLDEYRTP